MANSDKNIKITPNVGGANEPVIEFTGGDNVTLKLRVLDDGTLSFEGDSGQLMAIGNLEPGDSLFSANDISGIPAIEVSADSNVRINEHNGKTLIGLSNDLADSILQVGGGVTLISNTNQSFALGLRGAGQNAYGRTVLIEGSAGAADGEGSGRIFFPEHNSTSASADNYGLSLYYEGGGGTLPSGFNPATGNATWSLRRHDNSVSGAPILRGVRTNSDVICSGKFTVESTVDQSIFTSGGIWSSKDVVAYSDERLKENLVPIQDALESIEKVSGYTYNRKYGDKGKAIGVSAQEIQRVFPDAVHVDADGILSVAYGNLVAPLIEAVKELSAQVKELRDENTKIRAELKMKMSKSEF